MCLAGQRRAHESRPRRPHICPPPSSDCYLQTGPSQRSPKDRSGSAAPHWRPGTDREDFAARFFRRNGRSARTVSTQNGRSPITGAIIRNPGRAAPATSASPRRRFQTRFSARNSCRFWMRIVMSNVPLSTACSFSCSYSRHSFCSKLRRAKKFIRFNI